MPTACEQAAVRASCAPPPRRPFVKREETPAVPKPQTVVDLAEDDDEVMIKIDPNASFLEYDTDTPPPEEPVRAKKPTKKRQAQPNAARKRTGVAVVRNRRYREDSIDDFVIEDNNAQYETDRSSLTGSRSGESDVSDDNANDKDYDHGMLEQEDLEDL